MSALPPYHLSEHSATVLLDPVRLSLAQLERRLQHYADRIPMGDGDRETINQAKRIVERALHEIQALGKE